MSVFAIFLYYSHSTLYFFTLLDAYAWKITLLIMSHFYTGRDGRDGRDGPAGIPGSPGTPGLGTNVVQSLNSPFFPPHTGAEPGGGGGGGAKRESRITCMRMLRTPPFFSPKSGGKPYLEVFSRFGLSRDF